jgi:hypothetical protein
MSVSGGAGPAGEPLGPNLPEFGPLAPRAATGSILAYFERMARNLDAQAKIVMKSIPTSKPEVHPIARAAKISISPRIAAGDKNIKNVLRVELSP